MCLAFQSQMWTMIYKSDSISAPLSLSGKLSILVSTYNNSRNSTTRLLASAPTANSGSCCLGLCCFLMSVVPSPFRSSRGWNAKRGTSSCCPCIISHSYFPPESMNLIWRELSRTSCHVCFGQHQVHGRQPVDLYLLLLDARD